MEKESKRNIAAFQEEDNNHCEKVRRILEQKPVFIVRWGNTLLLIFLFLLLLVVRYSALSDFLGS